MKKLLSLLAFAGMLFVISCSDDDDPSLPTLIAPSSATTGLGETATATFTFTADAGFASSAVAGTGVDATVTTDGTSGATSGDIVVEYTVTALGSNSVVLTITDADGGSVDATLLVNSTNFSEVTVSGSITENTTWASTNVYILDGRVFVEDGITLTIEAGTIVKAETGQAADASALIVRRGGTIMAEGTASAPIIFTSILDGIEPGSIVSPTEPDQRGLWGGVILLGNAPISASNDNDQDVSEVQIEGIPTSVNALYGGSNPMDNSGTMRYVSIRHSGAVLGSGDEIQGLTLGGVGSGTTLEWIEIVASDDDGIEWFGGNVDMSGVLIWNSRDDGLDTDQDWIGTCDNFIVVTPSEGSGLELDGPEGSTNRGVHNFTNGTIYAGELGEELVDLDDDTNVGISNVYFYGITTPIIVESFGGDGNGTFENWEYTLGEGISAAVVFGGVPESILTEVEQNQNTVGVQSEEGFEWTWASQSGALSAIGL